MEEKDCFNYTGEVMSGDTEKERNIKKILLKIGKVLGSLERKHYFKKRRNVSTRRSSSKIKYLRRKYGLRFNNGVRNAEISKCRSSLRIIFV